MGQKNRHALIIKKFTTSYSMGEFQNHDYGFMRSKIMGNMDVINHE